MKRYLIVLAAFLAGCAGVNYSLKNYSGVKDVHFSDPTLPSGFRIFDKPSDNRMMITIDSAAAISKGLTSGATLGLAKVSTPLDTVKLAADLWFKSVNRPCRASSATEVIAPTNYEVFYSCS